MTFDILIVGGGPAGLSAAVNAAARGKTCALCGNDYRLNPLYKTKAVDNYLGMRGTTGAAMLEQMHREAEDAGTVFLPGRVTTILPTGDTFLVARGTEMTEARRVILATGTASAPALPGEEALIGRGVSYCATCDGMLYRGKRAVVTGDASDLAEEAAFLHGIGVQVTVVTHRALPAASEESAFPMEVAHKLAVEGHNQVEAFLADGRRLPCEAVFILREVSAPDALVPGLELDGRFVHVNRAMETNIAGLYAAGDCVGPPLQVAVAVGEGLTAAQNAARSLGA